jgi:hypothetical protein
LGKPAVGIIPCSNLPIAVLAFEKTVSQKDD